MQCICFESSLHQFSLRAVVIKVLHDQTALKKSPTMPSPSRLRREDLVLVEGNLSDKVRAYRVHDILKCNRDSENRTLCVVSQHGFDIIVDVTKRLTNQWQTVMTGNH